MRLGRLITAGTMAAGAFGAYRRYRHGHEEPTRGRGRRSSSRGRRQQDKGWFGTPFSIRH